MKHRAIPASRRFALLLLSAIVAIIVSLPGQFSPADAAPPSCRIPSSTYSSDSTLAIDNPDDSAPAGVPDVDVNPSCGIPGVPLRLYATGTSRIDTAKFPIKTRNGYRENRGQAWSIEKDTAGHGGRAWKLKNPKGQRVASLAPDGAYLAP